ncbi:MAG: hypothetical protein AB1756_08460, partial [Acidobacteriota bacterium]
MSRLRTAKHLSSSFHLRSILFVSILVSSAAFGLLFGAEEQKVALQGKGKELCVVCHEDLE